MEETYKLHDLLCVDLSQLSIKYIDQKIYPIQYIPFIKMKIDLDSVFGISDIKQPTYWNNQWNGNVYIGFNIYFKSDIPQTNANTLFFKYNFYTEMLNKKDLSKKKSNVYIDCMEDNIVTYVPVEESKDILKPKLDEFIELWKKYKEQNK